MVLVFMELKLHLQLKICLVVKYKYLAALAYYVIELLAAWVSGCVSHAGTGDTGC